MSGNSLELSLLNNLYKITKEIASSPLTATKLMRTLDLSQEEFNKAVKYGIKQGFLECLEYNYYKLLKEFSITEDCYYGMIHEQLCNLWLGEGYKENQFFIENTSKKDSRICGQWTRPDFTLVSYKKFPWTIGHEFDVVTFEVKRPEAADVLAVFEALSHTSVATRSYVVFPVSVEDWHKKVSRDQEKRVRDECARHGIGLILIEDPFTDPKPQHVFRATRKEIDHQKCSNFLDAVVSQERQKQISEWKT